MNTDTKNRLERNKRLLLNIVLAIKLLKKGDIKKDANYDEIKEQYGLTDGFMKIINIITSDLVEDLYKMIMILSNNFTYDELRGQFLNSDEFVKQFPEDMMLFLFDHEEKKCDMVNKEINNDNLSIFDNCTSDDDKIENTIKSTKLTDTDTDFNSDIEDNEDDRIMDKSDTTDRRTPINDNDDEISCSDKYEAPFDWRDNQILAIKNTVKQNFASGLHYQITGSGKSYVMLNLAQKHHEIYRSPKNVYVICCYRKEVLNNMFFDANGRPSKAKVKYWKDKKIINLDEFYLIDYVNNKPKKLDFTNNEGKPSLVIINNDFMVLKSKHDIDAFNRVKLVLVDECHAVSGKEFHKMLCALKFTKKANIIGFSATPLRGNSDKKLLDIFSKEMDRDKITKLNIISAYDYPSGLKQHIVLPFKYYYVAVNEADTENNLITDKVKDIAYNVINDVIKTENLPYRKMIAWTRRVEDMHEWYYFFSKKFKKMKIYESCYNSPSVKDEQNIKDFHNAESDAIMVCVNRFREGSDIKNVDCAIYLDMVEKRGILPAIQTSGRICRPDAKGKKTRAVIIDMFVNDKGKTSQRMTIHRILDYSMKILNLADCKNKIDEMTKLYEVFGRIKTSEIDKTIHIPMTDNPDHDTIIKFTEIGMDWNEYIKNFQNSMSDYVKRKFGADDNKILLAEYNACVNKNKFLKIKNKVMYKEFNKKITLKDNPEEYFKDIWKNWYHYLGIDTSKYPRNINDFVFALNKYKIKSWKEYVLLSNKYNLPEMPDELYIEFVNWNNCIARYKEYML